jgi:hypothetical protein
MNANTLEIAQALNDTARQVVEEYRINVVPEHFTEWELLPTHIKQARIAQAVRLMDMFDIQTLEVQP